jgi:putative protein-disulfide isomerase
MTSRPKVTVTHYTDPWSVWCWAVEPQLLRLRERHGANVDFKVKLGAIIESPVGNDFPREEIRRMFSAARRASGMPLDPDIVMRPWAGTTVRAGIAAKAVNLAAPEKFPRYLRALREAALVEGRNIEALEVQEDLARACGVDAQGFREAMETDEATREFYGDQAEGRLKGVTGFPTVVFRSAQGVEVGVGGFQPTEAFESALMRVSGARWVDEPAPDPVDLLTRHGKLATAEIAETCDWLEDVATERLLALEQKGALRHEERCGAFFWTAT